MHIIGQACFRTIAVIAGLAGALIATGSTASAQDAASAFTFATRYDAGRRVTGTIAPDPDGDGALHHAAVRNSYDASGRLSKVETGELAAWQSETTAPKEWTGFSVQKRIEFLYDDLDRKVRETAYGTGAAMLVTQYSYDLAGRLQCTAVRMDPATFDSLPASACDLSAENATVPDRITKNEYDAAGQLTKVIKAYKTSLEQNYVTYTYTANGKQASVTDAGGNKAELTYDGHDRLEYWKFPHKSQTGTVSSTDYEKYGYDANGNRTSLRRRDNKTLTFTYDALNRMITKAVPGGCASTPAGTCTSATGDLTVYYGYDLRGLQTYARFVSTTGSGITNIFDGFGRLTSSTSSTGNVTRKLDYEYDAAGNRTKITHPDGTAFTYDYDGLDRLKEIKNGAGNSITNLAYYDTGQRRWLGHNANGTGYRYDGIGRLDGMGLQRFANGSLGVDHSWFEFNPASQVVRVTRTSDAYAWTGAASVDRSYVVNGLNQYTSANPSTYGYDDNGNLTASTAPEGPSQQQVTRNYGYDAENRLYSATGGVTLSYDPTGRLFQVSGSGGNTTRFLYDGNALVAEYDANGTITRRYVHADGDDTPILEFEGSATTPKQLMADHQGSIVATTQHGWNLIGINTYDEYGIDGTNNTGRFGYTGQAYIPELGMYYYKARIYSPRLGRFLQTDPIGYDDQINLYAYVGNDPVNMRDPDGQQSDAVMDRRMVALRDLTRRSAEEQRRSNAVRINGGNPSQRAVMQRALQRVFSTPRGQQIQQRAAQTSRQESVNIVNDRSNAGGSFAEGKAYVDPGFHPPIATAGGAVPASTERVLAHELGHSVMGDRDNGPGKMNNVNRNENPVARALGEPERTRYERPKLD